MCIPDVNECVVNLCQNGGSCVNTFGGYYCKCPTGWSGSHCDIGRFKQSQFGCWPLFNTIINHYLKGLGVGSRIIKYKHTVLKNNPQQFKDFFFETSI